MDPTTAIILGSFGVAGSAGSSAASAGRSRKAQRRQQSYTRENMIRSRDYTRQLRQTAFQDATGSMKLAGLNPALMYGGGANVGGSNAGAPSGASAVSAQIDNPIDPQSLAATLTALQQAENLKTANAKMKYDLEWFKSKGLPTNTPLDKFIQRKQAGQEEIKSFMEMLTTPTSDAKTRSDYYKKLIELGIDPQLIKKYESTRTK